ncbi:MAG TPA: dihydrolipoamide acetyltransferase family protein [Candidatus Thermoplasmatota archaeon]|jgi:pyruvate dehydrogenase E2 component (dihydrolipoamide acetyltransferase)|nr:dihydrolipoamide acetyltransferase family protein [Candidatus Thermoplasmatota archaeon]
MFEFKLPDIGEGIHEGEVVRWLVKEGEFVREDQPLVEVMTDKATVEITSPRAGKIARLAAQEGQVLKVGELLVAIDEAAKPDERAAPSQPASKAPEPPKADKKDVTLFEGLAEGHYGSYASPEARARMAAQGQGEEPVTVGGRVLATPATRKLARELGVDIARVRGSGPHGRVTSEDVEAAANGPRPGQAVQVMQPLPPGGQRAKSAAPTVTAAGPDVERVPIRALRKRIYENMRRSKDFAAHFTYVEECDVEELVQLRDIAKPAAERQGTKLTYLPFIVKAVVAALKQYPDINAHIDDARLELVRWKRYNIGIAVQTERGLMVFVVKDADRKGLLDIAKEMQVLSDQAREGKSKADDLQGSTFTITSLGKTGGLLATPIINYPEVAIMGIHKIEKRAVVEDDGRIVARDRMNLSFSFDHRVIDGAIGAEFAHAVIRYIEDPKLLLLESA